MYSACVAAFFGCCLIAQTRQVVTVTGPRPLWSALDQIETAMGTPINLEEPPYENLADTEPNTDPRVRNVINGRQTRFPRKGTVSVEFDAFPSPADRILCVNSLLASYRQNNMPGEYRVEEANGALYVVGVGTRGVDGKPHAVTSPMLTRVSVPFERRRLFEAVVLIVNQVSKATGKVILPGTTPNGLAEVTFGTDGDTARDALAKLFRAANPTAEVSYRLLAGTTGTHDYMLNLRIAGAPDGSPLPAVAEQPAPTDPNKWMDPVRK